MKYILSLFITLWSIAVCGQEEGFDPSNPEEPGIMYSLTVNVFPAEAGSTSPSGKHQYALGQTVNVNASAHTGFRFVGWKLDEAIVSGDTYFSYTIPAAHTVLTAVFKYQPEDPDEPNPVPLQHKLFLEASPKEGGSFNVNSGTLFKEGSTINLQAYLNSGYEFAGWKQGETMVSAGGSYSVVMGTEDLSLTGVFRFNPGNPGNPGANYWNAETGEVIIDDFTTGNIMSAIDAVIQGSANRSKVTMLTVGGEMSLYDFGVAGYLSNCTLLDLSRTKDYSEIPDYAFNSNETLTAIVLPAAVENIGYRAFYNCSGLANLSCYAVTPPVVRNNAFDGVNEGMVIHVLSSSISLYSEAEGWKDFTILPLTEEVRALEVNLPAGSEGTYKNMTLELTNEKTGQKQKYVVSERLTYTFNGLLRNCKYSVALKTPAGAVLGQIDGIDIKDENVSVTFNSLLALLDVSLKVLTPDGTDVTDQVQITWLDARQAYLSQGSLLKGQVAATELNYRILLNQNLGMQYVFPENQTYSVKDSENQLVCMLVPIEKRTVFGLVKDVNGGNLSGAVVAISQKLNGKYSKSFTAQSDVNGKFELQVYNDESTVVISATDYISQTLSKEDFTEGTDLGTIALKSVTGATISLNFTYTPSISEGEETEVQDWYPDYANVAYTIYNVSQDKTITQFSIQYPSIVLLEEVAESDQLRITASSKNNSFLPVEGLATIDAVNKANVTFNIIALGGMKASYTSTDNASVVGILYDSKGELMKKYTYSNASLSVADLPDGTYTLVSMANSGFFSSILKLSQLAASGLTEGIDYVQNEVKVRSGLIVQITNEKVPSLDESKLYYTGNNTSFTVNKPSIVAGNYLTLKGKIDFKSEYADAVSDVRMIVDLPEASSFVDNSVMVGSQVAGYTLDGNRLIIPLSNYTDQVRFCIIPTAGGTYNPNAFVEFSMAGKTVQQPIGSAYYEVKDLTISVPKTVAKTTIPISGTALGNSTIDIYDNDILIGQTTSLANGIWTATCDLNQPYNLSTHSIYAKVKKADLELQSETQEVTYDMNAIQVSTVTMNFYNGWLKKNIDVVFDLQKGTTSASSYMFYTATDVTFVVDFTNNNPEVVSDVTLYVFTDKNEVRALKPTYDKKNDRWVAVSEFESNNLPINVSVDFDYEKNLQVDVHELEDAMNEFESYANQYADVIKAIDDFFANDSNLSEEKIAALEARLGISFSVDSVNNDEEITLPDGFDSWTEAEKEAYFNKAYQQVSGDIDLLVSECEPIKDLFELRKEYEQTFGGGSSFKLKTCVGLTPEQLLDDGYEKVPLTDSTFVYTLVTDTIIGYADFERDVYISITVNTDSGRELLRILRANDKSWREKVAEVYSWIQRVRDSMNAIYNDLLGIAKFPIKAIDEAIGKLEKQIVKVQRYQKMCNKHLTNPTYLKWNLEEFRLKKVLGSVRLAKNLMKPLIQRLLKCIPFIDYLATLNDVYDCAGRINSMYLSIPDPCEEDQAKANGCKLSCGSLLVAVGSLAVADVLGNFSADAEIVGGAIAGFATSGTSLVATGWGIVQKVVVQIGKFALDLGKNYAIDHLKKTIESLECKKDDEPDKPKDPKNPPTPTTPPTSAIHDPSGYVYEAVESNRLPGATATCYYKEMVEDMYGDLHEEIVLWDAAEYAQENPLFTDENGMYAWDVPQGLWQVKFEKEGYQTTYSEWLPVPPPQLEVNIGMVQTVQPTVAAVRGYETGIEIDFSKFMLPSTVTAEHITVTRNGESVVGEVLLKDAEIDPANAGENFVSRVRFVPAEALATTDKVMLIVSKQVKSYAGIQMENDFNQEIDIMKEAKSIVASDMEVAYDKTAEMVVTVEPAEASAGKKITVVSASPMIAAVTPAEAVLDAEGNAAFIVSGELLGCTVLQFAVEGMNLTTEVKVNVVPSGEEEVTQNYRLSIGWNWISMNVEDPNLNNVTALLEPIKESVVVVKGQNEELTNRGEQGLQGTLAALLPSRSYKIEMNKEVDWQLTGKQIHPSETTITLNKGWNWMGYPSSETVSVEAALQNLVAEENDVMKGLDCFAIYTGSNWIGSLVNLIPGEGYMYYSHSIKSFNYAVEDVNAQVSDISSQWEYDSHQQADNMTVIAHLYENGQQVKDGKYLLGAFVGSECRGVAVEKDGYLFLTIHGERVTEKISLRAFDVNSDKEYTIKEALEFSDAMKGSCTSPVDLHVGDLVGIEEAVFGLLFYPNPVRDRLYIRGDSGEISEIHIMNTSGQVLIVSDIDTAMKGIDVSFLSKGFYFVIVKSGDEMIRRKIFKIE